MNPIKKSNRTRILEFLFRMAPVSRATIAENTDITPATVTTTTATLLEENVIFDLGETESSTDITPGRKRILLDLNPSHRYSMGVELTEKHISFCITNLRGAIIDQIILPSTLERTLGITELILTELNNLIARNSNIATQLIGIGIAIPGKVNVEGTGLITDSAIGNSLDIIALKNNLNLPVVLENNIRAMAYGQYLFNPTHTPPNFALFQVGTGMYCASMIDGALTAPNNHMAGEVGHTIVQIDGRRCECGKYGCLQNYASERWLLNASKLLYNNNASPILKSLVTSSDELTLQHVITAYIMGDAVLSTYIVDAIRYLSMTISNIATIINPEKIYVHGELFSNNIIYQQLIDALNRDFTFMNYHYAQNVTILPYDVMRGALGASALAIDTYFINAN